MHKIASVFIVIAIALSSAPLFPADNLVRNFPSFQERLPVAVLDILPPSARVRGEPPHLQITERSCRSLPLDQVRRRIVDATVQEWGYFGFQVDEQVRGQTWSSTASSNDFRRPAMSISEARRLSNSIAGYWAATPDSDWILARQNDNWQRNGIDSRWRDAWSAAFISWVMCESGLGDTQQFRRAIAHHTYIDQAILARDGAEPRAAFKAFSPGEQPLLPGDLICRGSRPAYRSIEQRRTQLGEGARTHCDIVIKVDEARQTIATVGGNVRGSVRMKLLPATRSDSGHWFPESDRGRVLFAHLQLNAAAVEADAMDNTPTLRIRGQSGSE